MTISITHSVNTSASGALIQGLFNNNTIVVNVSTVCIDQRSLNFRLLKHQNKTVHTAIYNNVEQNANFLGIEN